MPRGIPGSGPNAKKTRKQPRAPKVVSPERQAQRNLRLVVNTARRVGGVAALKSIVNTIEQVSKVLS